MHDATESLRTLSDPFTSAQAVAAGLTQPVVERLVRHGDITRVGRGLFRRLPDRDLVEPHWVRLRRDHLVRARAAVMAHPHHALSHQTRAVATGWPVVLPPRSLVHLTAVGVQPRSRRVADRFLHHSDSIDNDVDMLEGMAALTAPRTVADCLRTMPEPDSVAVADAALRDGSTTLADVEAVLRSQHQWLGRPRALAALTLIDPRRESWLESYSFAVLSRLGIEPPVPQVEVFDAGYRLVGRVDGMWINDATVAEADGLGKYLIADPDQQEATGLSAARRVVAERGRERALQNLGLQVVRWDTDEIRHHAADVARRVTAARAAGSGSPFRGRIRVRGLWVHPSEHRLACELAPERGPYAG